MAKLVINLSNQFIDSFYFNLEQKITIGRSPKCDVTLDNIAISNEHATIYQENGKIFIEDLDSTNGTIINNKLISKHVLLDGEVIEISKYRLLFWVK